MLLVYARLDSKLIIIMVFVLLENYIYFSGQCVCYAYCYVRICGEACGLLVLS